ncbi:hypothetical protein [Flavilitoribacter nigricans]|uniref:Uncharacterized protein n=1 Tax=Flavilitoribacter nigricans (strain ATCC 23147 / DSM 23189 / NBRC 102662 / NCIMB 1420 / SS-2) TaxID=1122177 RepID=A0A2D0N546_FLAN2|nr:hypothetical protein [Flavilitoribacter nigricans]PHN03662.1 hypothetical protein CRP01_25770 [Flavilitoribacter nigricans DSM 23189 = NBRC 102662]
MKNLIIAFLVIGGFLSCKSQEDPTTFSEEFLIQIANDPLFIAYQETVHTDAENIVLENYDMEGIGKIFDALPFGTNICLSEEAKEKFSHLKGGELYLENECKRQELVQKLDQKFNYSSFPQDVAFKIVRIYRELNYIQLEERATDLYYRKN